MASATLVELDPRLAARRQAEVGSPPRAWTYDDGDAGDVSTYADVLPVDLLLLCGIFGNISVEDIERTVAAVPMMLADGGTVIWTRGWFGDATCDRRSDAGSTKPASPRSPSMARPNGSASGSPEQLDDIEAHPSSTGPCSASSGEGSMTASGDADVVRPQRRRRIAPTGVGWSTTTR